LKPAPAKLILGHADLADEALDRTRLTQPTTVRKGAQGGMQPVNI